MDGLGSSFQLKDSKYMVAEAMKGYLLASAEADYEHPREQLPIRFINQERGGYYENPYQWWDQKHPSFINQNVSENTNWLTTSVHTSVAKESIIKAIGGLMSLCSAGVELIPPYIMHIVSTLTVTVPIIWTQTWRSVQSSQFKSTPKKIQK